MQHLNLSFRSSWNWIFQFWEEITAPSCAGSVRPVNAGPSEHLGTVGICLFAGWFIPILFGDADYIYKLWLSPPIFLIFRCPSNACTYPDHKIYFNDKIVPSYIRFQSGIEFQILKKLNFIMKRQLNLGEYFYWVPSTKIESKR